MPTGKTNRRYIVIAVAVLVVLVSALSFVLFRRNMDESESMSDTASSSGNGNAIHVWDPETASFKEYKSYKAYEREAEEIRNRTLAEYNNATKGTIVQQLQNIAIPSYFPDEKQLVRLHEGKVEVRGDKNEDFPNGVFLWAAVLEKDVDSFAVGDFNNDGLDDVAHVIGYTGGGSGYFYELAIFLNDKGTLKYLTKKGLGDRVIIKSVKYASGEFVVDMITQGEGENFMGYCCPNTPVTFKFKLQNNQLVEE